MTTHPTGNPLGSIDPRDLFDNAENLDKAVNSEYESLVDRTGKTRKTWHSVESSIGQIIIAGVQIFPTPKDGVDSVYDGKYFYVVIICQPIICTRGFRWRLQVKRWKGYFCTVQHKFSQVNQHNK